MSRFAALLLVVVSAAAVQKCSLWEYESGGNCRALTTCTGAQYESQAPQAQWTYTKQRWGSCGHYIKTASECDAAATQLQLTDTTSQDDQQPGGVSWDPNGCYFESNRLKHHKYGTNTGSCSFWDECICKTVSSYVADRVCAPLTTCTDAQYESRRATPWSC